MNSLLKNECLNKCWLAGSSIALFKRSTECNTINIFDVSQNCKNILKVVNTKDLRISWSVIGQLVLGTVRIFQIQVEYTYENVKVLFANRPSFCLFSTISQIKYQPRKIRTDFELTRTQKKGRHSDIKLVHSEPKRGRYDWSDPDFISDFLSIHDETPEENLLAQIAAPDSLTTCNSLISIQETIPARPQSVNDDANNFGPASYHEIEEFFGPCDRWNISEHAAEIRVEIHRNPSSKLISKMSLC